MFENYAALAISILTNATPEQSFELYYAGKIKMSHKLAKDDVSEMVSLRQQGYSYKEIGEMFGIADNTVYRKVRNYSRKEAM